MLFAPDWKTMNHCLVCFARHAIRELAVQVPMSFGIFCKEYDPAGVFVQAVDSPNAAIFFLKHGTQIGEVWLKSILDG